MIDVICATSFGPENQGAQGAGALESRACGGQESALSMAIGDFAKRGVMVCCFLINKALFTEHIHGSNIAERISEVGVGHYLPHAEQTVEKVV